MTKEQVNKAIKSSALTSIGPSIVVLSGKVKMAYYGMFEGCDLAISWHPMTGNAVMDDSYLACAYAKFYFTGTTSHAAFAPHLGRSALDAMELMNVGVNYLREHVIDSDRIHYATDSCGYPPNIVPGKAVNWYCIRALKMSDARSILNRIEKIAKGALYAAKVITGTAYKLLTEPAKTAEIIKEFKNAQVEYSPMYKD